jgi:threonine dehydratase
MQATIVMPEDVSIRKLLAVKEYGAEVILFGKQFGEAYKRAEDLSKQSGKIMIPAFADPDVIAGQGTIGLEMLEALDEDAAVVVPVGGGGLISGVAVAVKAIFPKVKIIGVQTRACPSTIRSLEQGSPAVVEVCHTLADGIAVNRPGDLNFSIIQKYVDEVVDVDEESIASAIFNLWTKPISLPRDRGPFPWRPSWKAASAPAQNATSSSSAAATLRSTPLTASCNGARSAWEGSFASRWTFSDVPGSLWKLMGIIAREKANILHIFHDRLNLENPLQISRVKLNLETRGRDHAQEVMAKLREAGYSVKQTL